MKSNTSAPSPAKWAAPTASSASTAKASTPFRERIGRLADPGAFQEAGSLVGATTYDAHGNLRNFTPGSYVMGLAEINGRPVALGGDDFTISGGSPTTSTKAPCSAPSPWPAPAASP